MHCLGYNFPTLITSHARRAHFGSKLQTRRCNQSMQTNPFQNSRPSTSRAPRRSPPTPPSRAALPRRPPAPPSRTALCATLPSPACEPFAVASDAPAAVASAQALRRRRRRAGRAAGRPARRPLPHRRSAGRPIPPAPRPGARAGGARARGRPIPPKPAHAHARGRTGSPRRREPAPRRAPRTAARPDC